MRAQTTDVGAARSINVGADQTTTMTAQRIDERSAATRCAKSHGAHGLTTVGKDDAIKSWQEHLADRGCRFRCRIKTGDASITMKKDGTIEIKGKDITIEGSGKINVKASKRHCHEGLEDSPELTAPVGVHMKIWNPVDEYSAEPLEAEESSDPLRSLVVDRAATGAGSEVNGVVIGELIGMTEDGSVPLVLYPGQPGSAGIAARSTVDLHEQHVGRQVVLLFDTGDPRKPIVMGVLRNAQTSTLAAESGHAEVEADGERMIVSAKEQLVLRCGKARITLTCSGKVLIEGAYVSSRSSGVNRIRGGSVQLN